MAAQEMTPRRSSGPLVSCRCPAAWSRAASGQRGAMYPGCEVSRRALGDSGGVSAKFQAAQPDVAAVTSHLYPASACDGSVVTISKLLGAASRQYETAGAQALVSAASQLHVPAVVDETNSAVCGGAAHLGTAHSLLADH
jgi:hypothetical protein